MAGITPEIMENTMRKPRKMSGRQSGFTLLEAMISIVVLSVGVLGLAAVYSQGLFYAALTQYDYIAEKKAEQAVESMFTARDIKSLSWSEINNVSQGGVFVDGPQKILVPGTDGLVGTQTDAGAADELITTGPGADGIFGTPDDTTLDLNPWMTRTIAIAPVIVGGVAEPNLRQVTVTITYTIGTKTRTYVLVSYISAFA
jgi:prepilin-type N-terminal cleavage/methylation domain-containing protein